MVASKFKKGDYRRHGPLTAKPTTFRALGKKQGYTEPASGQNRHERRAHKQKYRLAIRGKPGSKLVRKLFRETSLQEAFMLMHGYNRGIKRHPGYATMGAYDKTGGRLASPRSK